MSKKDEKTYLLEMPEWMHTDVKTFASMTGSNMKKFILDSVAERLQREGMEGGALYGQKKG